MDDETRAHLEAMESRLMARLNDSQERLLERMRGLETTMRALETAIGALMEIARGTNTMLATITGLLTDLGRRVTDLEKKP